SKPSSSLTFTKHSVCVPLTVNGRIEAPNGPTLRVTSNRSVLATVKKGDFSPARYASLQSGPAIVLCEPESCVMRATTSPSSARPTYQRGPSNDGKKIVLPSGVMAIRSQPMSYVFSQSNFSLTRSMQNNCLVVLT